MRISRAVFLSAACLFCLSRTAAQTTYFDEPNYLAAVAAGGWATVTEGFENDDPWGLVRTTIVYGTRIAPDAPSKGITWDGSGGGLHSITTSEGAANFGTWGFYSSPHGDILSGIHDGLTVSCPETMYAFGIWIRGTFGANVILIVDGDEANPIDLGSICTYDQFGEEIGCIDRNLGNTDFVGFTDTDGFNTVEIRETEANGDEAQYLWFDNATIGFVTTPSARVPGVRWSNAAGGTYDAGGNWTGGAAPDPNNNAIFRIAGGSYGVTLTGDESARQMVVGNNAVALDLGGHTLYLTQTNILRDSLIVAERGGDNGQLTLSNGSVTPANVVVARRTGVTGNLDVGGGATLDVGYSVRIGAGGTGALNVGSGGSLDTLLAYVGQFGGSGALNVDGATATYHSASVTVVGDSGAGSLSATNGAQLTPASLDVGAFADGTVSLDGAGTSLTASTLSVGSGDQVGSFYSSGAVYHNGNLTVSNGAAAHSTTAYVGETRTGVGVITVTDPNSSWTNPGSNTFIGYEGDGTLNVLNGGTVTTGSTFIGRFGIHNVLRGTANVDGAGSTWNAAILYVGFANNGSCFGGTFSSEGRLNITGGGLVNVTQLRVAERTFSAGFIDVSDAGSTLSAQGIILGNLGTRCGSVADLRVGPGGAVTASGDITVYHGALDLAGGAIAATDINLYAGPTVDPNDPNSGDAPGVLSGAGAVTGNVTCYGGVIRPNYTLGALTVTGDYADHDVDANTIQPTATLAINIGPGGHDAVSVSGAITLNGKLRILAEPNFAPAAGSTFEILSGASVSGSFSVVAGSVLKPNLRLEPRYTATTVYLEVVSDVVIGDIDGDGDVDLADLAGLLSAFGSCVGDSGFVAAADIDGNGCIDLADLAGLLANFGA
ncbi:MAG: hypothetical protein KDA32_10825 [Phycisphaerales bacterium]|nr:hypothetical protein [Phycisphaerales bacterium]